MATNGNTATIGSDNSNAMITGVRDSQQPLGNSKVSLTALDGAEKTWETQGNTASTHHVYAKSLAIEQGLAQQEIESQIQLDVTPDATHATSAPVDNVLSSPAKTLLSKLWPSPDKAHFLGTMDRQTGKFRNIPVSSIVDACQRAQKLSEEGSDAYFAVAEYASPVNRTSNNVVSASTFIVDIDLDKAGTGKGYATLDGAQMALDEFCTKTNLPKPNHFVGSGSGGHGYWIYREPLGREKWQIYAAKLKALMKSAGLRADPSRTADIASVLRVPGTLNYKYSPPRPVETISSSDELIELEAMLDAIDAAMVTIPVVANAPVAKSVQARAPMAPEPFDEDIDRDPPNLRKLASALKALSPDCDEKTWKFHTLAPMAYEARYFPVLHDALYKLASDWSSGDLGGVPSIKWNEPGSHGLSGNQCFDRVWRRFLKDSYTGKRPSLGTIFWRAKQTGWEFSNDFGGDAENNGKEVS